MVKKNINQFLSSRIILPRHRDKLKKHLDYLDKKEREISPPEETQKEELFQYLIEESLNENLEIQITCKEKEGPLNLRGIVKKIDLSGEKIHLTGEKGLVIIPRKKILEVKE